MVQILGSLPPLSRAQWRSGLPISVWFSPSFGGHSRSYTADETSFLYSCFSSEKKYFRIFKFNLWLDPTKMCFWVIRLLLANLMCATFSTKSGLWCWVPWMPFSKASCPPHLMRSYSADPNKGQWIQFLNSRKVAGRGPPWGRGERSLSCVRGGWITWAKVLPLSELAGVPSSLLGVWFSFLWCLWVCSGRDSCSGNLTNLPPREQSYSISVLTA